MRPRAAKPAATTPSSLRATAIRMLARRDIGRVELAERLCARGGAPDDVAGIVEELERGGYLSDDRCAQAVVDRKAGRYGKRAIAHELKERRITPDAAAKALEALSGDELAQARALWQRRFGEAPKTEQEKSRQLRFLYSRGYSTAVAWKVLRLAGAQEDDV